jgi:hypothetical protein
VSVLAAAPSGVLPPQEANTTDVITKNNAFFIIFCLVIFCEMYIIDRWFCLEKEKIYLIYTYTRK